MCIWFPMNFSYCLTGLHTNCFLIISVPMLWFICITLLLMIHLHDICIFYFVIFIFFLTSFSLQELSSTGKEILAFDLKPLFHDQCSLTFICWNGYVENFYLFVFFYFWKTKSNFLVCWFPEYDFVSISKLNALFISLNYFSAVLCVHVQATGLVSLPFCSTKWLKRWYHCRSTWIYRC